MKVAKSFENRRIVEISGFVIVSLRVLRTEQHNGCAELGAVNSRRRIHHRRSGLRSRHGVGSSAGGGVSSACCGAPHLAERDDLHAAAAAAVDLTAKGN